MENTTRFFSLILYLPAVVHMSAMVQGGISRGNATENIFLQSPVPCHKNSDINKNEQINLM
jgi:hypothetical protein